ncbi:hypothetical protein IWW36_003735 [Coemansia brasiliensis]|uniref:Uncharacterized protein n=1 Tax=Coemansia brasiliensis TaxID=2650707 RepID=A0A9W8LY93_9FUNG|nr:hypothetical protein IWW36_003735 [Coemansia brasiliensis]
MSTTRRRQTNISTQAHGKASRPQSRVGRGASSSTGSKRAAAINSKSSYLAAQQRQSPNRVRKHRNIVFNRQLDLSGTVGLTIGESETNKYAHKSNLEYIQQMAEDDYGSDDDLGDSEETWAKKQHTQQHRQLREIDNRLEQQWLEADKRDYERRGAVLDQSVVSQRLQALKAFGEHLRRVGKNRAALLARLAEPLAEEHWMLDAQHHERMVAVLQSMCGLVNNLPGITAAARHCASELPAVVVSDHDHSDSALNSRHIAQMERLVHEAEQAMERLSSGGQ